MSSVGQEDVVDAVDDAAAVGGLAVAEVERAGRILHLVPERVGLQLETRPLQSLFLSVRPPVGCRIDFRYWIDPCIAPLSLCSSAVLTHHTSSFPTPSPAERQPDICDRPERRYRTTWIEKIWQVQCLGIPQGTVYFSCDLLPFCLRAH